MINFDRINSVADYWNYLETHFLQVLHGKFITWPEKTVPIDFEIINENFLLGAPRIRQIRVMESKCDTPVQFKNVERCHPIYDSSYEDTSDYFHETKYVHPKDAGTFFLMMNNKLNYHAGGYIEYFDFDKDDNLNLIKSLHSNETNWIDHLTRMVVIEFALYNGNMNFFCQST